MPILKRIVSSEERAGAKRTLDCQYLKQMILYAYEVPQLHKGITASMKKKPVKLSKQQYFILTLLAQGYSNADIMKLTDLTFNTVKSHTRIVYQKLDVSNAADAVSKTRKIGLIEP